jgi:hypothetical protein
LKLLAELFAQPAGGVIDAILNHIGQGHDLDRPVLDVKRVSGCPSPPATATDQGDAKRIVLSGMDRRSSGSHERRGCGEPAGLLQELAARLGRQLVDIHKSPVCKLLQLLSANPHVNLANTYPRLNHKKRTFGAIFCGCFLLLAADFHACREPSGKESGVDRVRLGSPETRPSFLHSFEAIWRHKIRRGGCSLDALWQ